MEEQKQKKQKMKEEEERYNRKLEEEIKNYDPFGKGGGGAPMRDGAGNIIGEHCFTILFWLVHRLINNIQH